MISGSLFRSLARGLALTVGVVSSGPAATQSTQTVGGAHEFLRLMTSRGMTASVNRGDGWNMAWRSSTRRKCRWENYDNFFGSSGRRQVCYDDPYTGKVNHGPYTLGFRGSGCRSTVALLAPARYGDVADRTPISIDWSRVTKVSQAGLAIEVGGTYPELQFNLPSEDLAARAAFAAEFIRTSCDSTASTGF